MTEHVSSERFADYLAGLLDEPADEELEAHLFSCGSCALEAEKLAAFAVAVHRAVPPVLTAERFEELEREGRIAEVNRVSPGRIAEARYPPKEKILVLRLGGSDLSKATQVDMELLDRDGRVLARFDAVPFDARRGEVLVACQSHFAGLFPPDIVFRLEKVVGDTREEGNRYTVLHGFR
jgi:anti-sigma factor RsiW